VRGCVKVGGVGERAREGVRVCSRQLDNLPQTTLPLDDTSDARLFKFRSDLGDEMGRQPRDQATKELGASRVTSDGRCALGNRHPTSQQGCVCTVASKVLISRSISTWRSSKTHIRHQTRVVSRVLGHGTMMAT
jgi:hypothetical protein